MQTYLGWEELDDGPRPGRDDASADPIEGWPALQELLKERARIEQQLLKLLGKAPPDPADARDAARFPMPVHTAESRLADRQAAREEERARAAAKRAQERLRVRAREEEERLERKRDAEAAILKAQAQQSVEARRAEERRHDHAREVQVQAILRQAWEEQRVGALRNRQEAERLQWSHFIDRKLRCLERASARVARRRVDDRTLAARLDSRPRRHRRGDPFERPPRDARPA